MPKVPKAFGELMATMLHEPKVPKAFGELMATVMHELKVPKASKSSGPPCCTS